MWQYNDVYSSQELQHYGVLGQKWGVRRSQATLDRLAGRNKKLEKRAANRQLKADKYLYKATKKGESTRLYRKADRLQKRSSATEKKALRIDPNDPKYYRTKRKAAKYAYKSDITRRKAVQQNISNMQNIRLQSKAYKQMVKASKARYQIAKNNVKISQLDNRLVELGKQMVDGSDLNEDR